MGVDVPQDSVASILQEQVEWDKNREKTSTKEHLHKRYVCYDLLGHMYVEYFQQEPPEEDQEGSLQAGEVLHGDPTWTGECCGTICW